MGFNRIKSAMRTELLVWRSVYKLLGPLGILCRITGQFPASATLKKHALFLQYSFFSVASAYSILMTNLPCAMYLCLRLGRKPITNLYTLYSFSLRCLQILVQLHTTIGWPDVLGLVAELEVYDSQLYQLPVLVNRNPDTKSNRLVWLTLPFLQLINIVYIEVYFGRKSRLFYSIRPICATPLIIQTILFFFFLKGLIRRTKRLQQSWISYLKMAAHRQCSSSTLRLDLYRSLHNTLVNCYSLLNSAFAYTLFYATALLFLDFITEPYHSYKSGHFSHRFSDRLWCFVLIACIFTFTANLDGAVNIVLHEVFDIRVAGLSKCMRSHLDLLVFQLDRSKVKITVPGLVVFSRKFVGSFVAVCVTYFILAAQIAALFWE